MLLWVKPGTAPSYAVMAEMPRGHNTNDVTAAYLRIIVEQMQPHKTCYPSRCFCGSHGKTLSKCKYGFPFKVPEPKERMDDDGVRYVPLSQKAQRGCSGGSIQSRDSTIVGCSP